jgi:phytoene dehydrogenase-like protein
MTRYDVVVIGSGLGGLTAGAILAGAGRTVLVIERSNSVGGAASSYKAGDLFIEASLHKTSGPQHPSDPKHRALGRAGVLDKVEWVSTGPLHEVRGGPLDRPFVLPEGFAAARAALTARFPHQAEGIAAVLAEMEALAGDADALQSLQDAPTRHPHGAMSLGQRLDAAFGSDEAVKCAIAGNLWYFHDDPADLWWPAFAAGQGQFLQSGGRYVKTGSQRLSSALARTILRTPGCAVLLRRSATAIRPGRDGKASIVTHEAKAGGDPQEVEAGCIIGNAAPEILARLLGDGDGARLTQGYAARKPSISLFALTLGLARPPAECGLDAYSVQLLPDWMDDLASYAEGTALFASAPNGRMPPMSIVNYAAIDSGVPTSPFIVSVVGADRTGNWRGLERPAYEAKKKQWQAALIAALDLTYPGLAASVVASAFNTANSMVSYLNQPQGCAYGFAPSPPDASGAMDQRSPRTAIDGLYLASAYAGFGGYNGAIHAGEACADAVIADA